MKTEILKSAISQTTYPGRGIVLGKSPNGKFAVAAYFIMGGLREYDKIIVANYDDYQALKRDDATEEVIETTFEDLSEPAK